jgi:hypothetical protein
MTVDINSIRKKLEALQSRGKSSTEQRKIQTWKPSVGKQVVRILPAKFAQGDDLFYEMFFHYGIDKTPIAALTNWGEEDPVVTVTTQLRSQRDKESWRTAAKLEPKMRVYAPVIVRGEESEGVKLWGFGKEIYMELLSAFEDEDVGDYTDIMTGRDITLTTVGADATGTGFSKTTLRFRAKQTTVSEDEKQAEEWLNNQPNPREAFTKPTYDYVKEALVKYLTPASETEEKPEQEEEIKPHAKTAMTPETPGTNAKKFASMFLEEED